MSALASKVALVTGANTGIGLETARGLAEQGATVVMTSRNMDKGNAAVADVKATSGNDKVEVLQLDLASFASIRAAAETFLSKHDRLDILVNNAGLMLSERRTTQEGFEQTFGVNHLGHFLLTDLLLDRIKASAPARIINLSSAGHAMGNKGLDFDDLMYETRKYSGFTAYCDTKLANVYFTRSLAKRLEGTNVVTHAVHPGAIRSNFAVDGDVKGAMGFMFALMRPFFPGTKTGAKTSLHCAISADAGTSTGEYWARSKRKKPAPFALDEAAAERLWTVSEELIASVS